MFPCDSFVSSVIQSLNVAVSFSLSLKHVQTLNLCSWVNVSNVSITRLSISSLLREWITLLQNISLMSSLWPNSSSSDEQIDEPEEVFWPDSGCEEENTAELKGNHFQTWVDGKFVVSAPVSSEHLSVTASFCCTCLHLIKLLHLAAAWDVASAGQVMRQDWWELCFSSPSTPFL